MIKVDLNDPNYLRTVEFETEQDLMMFILRWS